MVKSLSQQIEDEEWKETDIYWDNQAEKYYVRLENERTKEEKWMAILLGGVWEQIAKPAENILENNN